MSFLSDNVLDNGLNHIVNNAEAVYICSQQPTTYTEASNTYALGHKTPITISGPVNGDNGGRKVTIAAIDDGTVTTSGTATHFAVVSNTNSELIATAALSTSQVVSAGNPFTLTEFDITIPDPSDDA